jgi:hypothetical protein
MAERPTTLRPVRSGKKVRLIAHDVAYPCKKGHGMHMVPCATYHVSQHAMWLVIMRLAREFGETTVR